MLCLIPKRRVARFYRYISMKSAPTDTAASNPFLDSSLVNYVDAPNDFHVDSAKVYGHFLTEEEGESLKIDVLSRMRRRRILKGHWDAVITNYKEIELQDFDSHSLSPVSSEAIERVRRHIAQSHSGINSGSLKWLPCHAIFLKKEGYLLPHVDSVKFSGGIVAGLSLMSSTIMRLKPASPGELDSADNEDSTFDAAINSDNKCIENAGHVDLLLPPLSLYVLSGVSRFRYTHELLPSGCEFNMPAGNSQTNTIDINRDDRISVIFRDTNESV
mmetsp:Transcript_28369/g.43457  ORF Transcript_28369/g.43457 Transcript_28369/m.43457 type:complete len:273 (-) Transcript_28369:2629-3447(-)